ncbi:peptidoglycan-binding protein [Spirulina subsalsa FACHB-351]|uniref:Peptidoglycan-binding protein n=1 Tax=Spirulina subsalsa FACHB-351 TaxID=234711 RepID=A0ABT3L3E9_9CYAN|nr:peptidoglycan-binding protein [Spirulina subsalsa]MCW6036034.1 peptidoglycan-binding protein [Spirulina subsalsa FACHB-351]
MVISIRRSLLLMSLILLSPLGSLPSLAQSVPIRPLLRMGSQGETVRELQAALRLLGYYSGDVTGIYDEQTVIAVSLFQRARNLPVNGIMGEESWVRLFPPPEASNVVPSAPNNPLTAFPPARPTLPQQTFPQQTFPQTIFPQTFSPSPTLPPVVRFGSRGETVRQLQLQLRSLGLFNGAVDGIFGNQTLEAVRAAQRRFNLPVDGIVGEETWRRLLQ